MHIVLVGCGNMGFAMLQGWVKAFPDWSYHIVEPNKDLQNRARNLASVIVYETRDSLPVTLTPDIIILAVKPNIIENIVLDYKQFKSSIFLSVAAGVKLNAISKALGGNPYKIIRTMPNTPAAVGQGMMASIGNEQISEQDQQLIDQLLDCSGKNIWLDYEDQMDAVTAISGSGPAYVFHFIEVLEKAAVELGLPLEMSRLMALQTVYGAASLASASDESPSKLRENVTSPNGTTQAALEMFMNEQHLEKLVEKAARAARDRSIELGS